MLFSTDLALTRSAKLYSKKYAYAYMIPKYDNFMIGLISKRITYI